MTPLFSSVLSELTFSMAADQLMNRVSERLNGLKQPISQGIWQYNIPRDEPVNCSCCGWEGKKSEARKRYLFVEHATELELFCQQCSSYLGFLPVEDQPL